MSRHTAHYRQWYADYLLAVRRLATRRVMRRWAVREWWR